MDMGRGTVDMTAISLLLGLAQSLRREEPTEIRVPPPAQSTLFGSVTARKQLKHEDLDIQSSSAPDGSKGVKISGSFSDIPDRFHTLGLSFVCPCGAPLIMTSGTKHLRCTCGRSYEYSAKCVEQVERIIGDDWPMIVSTSTEGGPTET